jgi:hypothetical protein
LRATVYSRTLHLEVSIITTFFLPVLNSQDLFCFFFLYVSGKFPFGCRIKSTLRSRESMTSLKDEVIINLRNTLYVGVFHCSDTVGKSHFEGLANPSKPEIQLFFCLWRYSPSLGLGLPP